MKKTAHAPATAADVRAWFAAHPKSVPAEAAHTVDVSAKGRIHPKAREVFNAKSGRTYTEGTTKTVQVEFYKIDSLGRRQPRKAHLPISEARALAGPFAGERGRLSEKALVFAGEAYTEKFNS